MDYHAFAEFARSWGVVYLMVLFLAGCAYAFWPRNQAKFDRAARMPLDEDQG
ncbi:MAG: cbb3-type cytochrome c oxidase subunit 3 [Alphaproteobacteria bacterium]|nr:cbb3-type cytochrome c oxidase subunit 3 [Alphaproteobacteria bacterium]